MKLLLISLTAVLSFSASIQAQIVLRADAYLDVRDGAIVRPATIVVVDGRIAAVNPARIPEGAEVIDLSGQILLPGLMDVHTHLAYDIYAGFQYSAVETSAADAALRGAMNARRTLHAGFTTVRDVGAAGFVDVSLKHAIDEGMIPGPHVIPVGNALGITGGHCDITGFAPGVRETDWRNGAADGPDEFLKALRYQIKHGAAAVKVCATAGVLSFEGPVGAQQMTSEEMRTVVEEADRHGLVVAAHAHGKAGIIAASKAGIDSIEHNSMMDAEAADVLLANGTWVVPNLYLVGAIDMDALPPLLQKKMRIVGRAVFESFRLSVQKGLKIAFGTDAGVYPHGDNAKEFAVRVENGMSEIEAIRGATVYAAELLRLEDRGHIAEGLLADVIGVSANPLEEIRSLENVSFVMKAGQVYRHP